MSLQPSRIARRTAALVLALTLGAVAPGLLAAPPLTPTSRRLPTAAAPEVPAEAAAPVENLGLEASVSLAGGSRHRLPATQSKRVPPRRPEAARDEAVLLLTPARRTLEVGDRLRLSVSAVNLRSLSRLPLTLVYDPQVLRFGGIEAGRLWTQGPEPVLLSDASRPGRVVIGVAQLGDDAVPLSGRGVLVDLHFEAIARGETELSLDRFALLGPDGKTQPSRARTAVVTVR